MTILYNPAEQVAQTMGSGMCQCPAAREDRAREQARREAASRPRVAQEEALRNLEAMRKGAEAPPPERARTFGEMCSGTEGRGDCEYVTGHAGPHSPGVPPSSPDGRRLNGLGAYQAVVRQGCSVAEGIGALLKPAHYGFTQAATERAFTRAEVVSILAAFRLNARMTDRVRADDEYERLLQVFSEMP